MSASSTRESLYFVAPREVAVTEEPVAAPAAGEVLVETLVSAISSGTELLVYRGEVPDGMALDATIPGLAKPFELPAKYGYSAVGRVTALGEGVAAQWLDRLVFSLHPHETQVRRAHAGALRGSRRTSVPKTPRCTRAWRPRSTC